MEVEMKDEKQSFDIASVGTTASFAILSLVLTFVGVFLCSITTVQPVATFVGVCYLVLSVVVFIAMIATLPED